MSGSKASKNFVHDQKIYDFTRSLQKDSFFTYVKGIDSFRLAYIKVDYEPPAYLFCILLKVETLFREYLFFKPNTADGTKNDKRCRGHVRSFNSGQKSGSRSSHCSWGASMILARC